MALESVDHIDDLVITNPVGGSDPKSEGDDHIRNIKKALKADFPTVDEPITASVPDLNATTNFEETISATPSEVTIKAGKTLNIVDDGAGLKLGGTVVTATASSINNRASAYRGAVVYNSAPQVMTNASYNHLTFDSEEYDTSGIHDTGSNTNRLTVPSGVTRVRLSAGVSFGASATGIRSAFISKNDETSTPTGSAGLPTMRISASSSGATDISLASGVITVTAGDFFSLACLHTHGSDLYTANSLGFYTYFSMEIIE